MGPQLRMLDIDRQIWEEELETFVPKRIFDMHSHIFKKEHCLQDADALSSPCPASGFEMSFLKKCWRTFLPGREVHYLLMGMPFPHCDFERMNAFVAKEAFKDPLSVSSMVVHPQMQPKKVVMAVEKYGFAGFKPYRFYSSTGDVVECSITDFLPEPLLEVANDKHLLITLHLGKRAGIADSDNIEDLISLTKRYPNVYWILAHCARSFNSYFLEKTIKQLRSLPKVWYDISAVCESGVFEILLRSGPLKRILYGSDSTAGLARGKYIAFGYGWSFLKEDNHSFDLSHCDPRMTIVLYEELRALRRAVHDIGLSNTQVKDLFYDNAMRLLEMRKA